jgi:hypothetical protein
MGEYDGSRLDRATGIAWSRFRVSLGDHVVAMADDDVLIIEAETAVHDEAAGAAPYVQFCGWGEGRVRAEVSSNAYLDARVALDAAAERALLGLGWNAPTHGVDDEPDEGSANFFVDADRRDGDRLAVMAVAALRKVFGVPHPAFLSWSSDDDAEDEDTDDAGDTDDNTSGGDSPLGPLAVVPESAEHLRTLVLAALAVSGGPAIEPDEDGDIPLPMGSAVLYVRVHEHVPVVEVFAVVVHGVDDRGRAAVEVAILNRDVPMVKFVLVGDAVIASVQVPAVPFAPRQLRKLVVVLGKAANRAGDDLVARVGGRRAVDAEPDREDDARHEPEEETLHPALQTLLELDPHGEGVDPELAASVCDYDRDLVLTLMTKASEQEIEWRRSGRRAEAGGDSEEAEVCFGEGRAWRVTQETLRGALRVIVERRRDTSEA